MSLVFTILSSKLTIDIKKLASCGETSFLVRVGSGDLTHPVAARHPSEEGILHVITLFQRIQHR
jgi:hypothetical protein